MLQYYLEKITTLICWELFHIITAISIQSIYYVTMDTNSVLSNQNVVAIFKFKIN